eukprot:TRINITY_DN496_c0_g1_i3.p2 TRINITY_DN496_c0_g1~~TRINITY_DN496_c0_g1_i3.p2  ORF type:complete len:141 (+),score=13.18 TRINITY_DN496_c0_g1_i3:1769-2191(+)
MKSRTQTMKFVVDEIPVALINTHGPRKNAAHLSKKEWESNFQNNVDSLAKEGYVTIGAGDFNLPPNGVVKLFQLTKGTSRVAVKPSVTRPVYTTPQNTSPDNCAVTLGSPISHVGWRIRVRRSCKMSDHFPIDFRLTANL